MEELRAKLLIESHSRASGQRASHTSVHQVLPVWRAPEGSAAVPVGGGGARPGFDPTHRTTRQHTKRRRCGGRRRDLPRCRWAAAGPGRASRRSTSTRQHTRSHWCGGCRRDLPRCRWAVAGPGRASRRRAERSSQRGRLAGGRALRRPEHPWDHKQPGPPAQHNETRPRPVSRPRPRHAHAAPFTTAPPAIRRSCPRDPRPRRGQPRGGRRGRGTGSRTRSRHPRCGRSGSTAGRHRARHTRRA